MKLDPPVTIHDLPIPKDAQATRLWSAQMLEMADHIGAYATLLLVDRLGGQTVRVPINPDVNRMATIIGAEKSAIMSRVYGGEQVAFVVAEHVLHEARRAPIIAAVRQGELTINAAVPILRMKRETISRLVRDRNNGALSSADLAAMTAERARRKRDPRQIDMFDGDAEAA